MDVQARFRAREVRSEANFLRRGLPVQLEFVNAAQIPGTAGIFVG
jgi:hypothetical protein